MNPFSVESQRYELVNELLTDAVPNLERIRPALWKRSSDNTAIFYQPLTASEGWLCVETPARLPRRVTPWDWLTQSRSWPLGTKFALDVLRAEAFLNEGQDDWGGRIQRLWRRFDAARQVLGGASWEESSGTASPAPELARWCTEAKWPFTPRAEGRVAVPLESGPVPVTALVGFVPPQTVCVAATLLQCEALGEASRHAIAILLMRLSKRVRCVRPAVQRQEELTVGLEVSLEAAAGAAELGHALAALSLACRMCAAEVEALQEETVAREFIATENTKTAPEAGKEEP